MPDPQPWYDTAFEQGYLELYPHRDLRAARAEAAALLVRGVNGRVLDLGCGFGRHLLALRERGLAAVGLDRSPALLARARELADGRLRGRLVRGDFRALPFGAGSFDALLMLFSSFGYFADDENARVLEQVARVLRPGGLAVFDLMNPERVRGSLVPESRSERHGREIVELRRLEHGGTRVVKEVLVRERDGSQRRWREDVRLYGRAEFSRLLEERGLVPLRAEGDFAGRAWDADAPRLIVWARRGQ
jgi:SAM-dependent methyltransferase